MSKIKAALGRQLDRLSGATKLIGAAFIGALLAGSLAWAAGSRVTLVDMDGNYVDASKTTAQDSNIVSVNGTALALGATTASGGIPIAFPTDQPITASFAGNSVWTELVPANTTGVLVGSAGSHQILSFSGFTKSTTEPLFVRLYDVGTAPTCSSATGIIWHGMIPAPALGGGGASPSFPEGGIAVTSGIGICISAGYGDTDTTSPTTAMASANVVYR